MHLSYPVSRGSRARRACAALLVAGLVASCHDSSTNPLTRVAQLQPVESALQVKAGRQWLMKVLVLDGNNAPVVGVPVNWEASSGVLSNSITSSNGQGIAVTRWTADTAFGDAAITALVGNAPPLVQHITVVPGSARSLIVLADSVVFTAQEQKRTVKVVGTDQYGRQVPLRADQIEGRSELGVATATGVVGDTALVELTSGYGTHRGSFTIYSISDDANASGSVLLVLHPVLVGIKEIAGLDSVNGLAVGEHASLKVTGLDSLGHPILDVGVASSGLQLTTSDAAIATTAGDGSVTAVAPGRVTITATAGPVTYRVPVTVFPVFDVGTQTAAIALHDPNAYFQNALDQYLTDAGALYELSHYIGAGAPPHPETAVLRARTAGGAVAWTRNYPTSYVEVIADPASGIAYLADHLHVIHAIDPAGTDRWSFDYGTIDTGRCRLAGWKDGVVAACSTHVFALNGSGSLSWSVTLADSVQQVITAPALTIARVKGSVVAIADGGTIAWSKSSNASDLIADASSTVYLVDNGVHAVDAHGVERWYNATPLGGCVLATADRLVVCRNLGVITALDPADGHVRWSATSPTSFGSMAAISGDRILVCGAFLFALDARSGAVLGRSLNRFDEYDLSVGNGTMAATSISFGRVFSTSFTPGSGWAQRSGNAGHGHRVSP